MALVVKNPSANAGDIMRHRLIKGQNNLKYQSEHSNVDFKMACCMFPVLGWGFPGGSDSKESACNVGDLGSIPGSGRSPGEGNGNPLQYSCLENSMDEGA